MFTFSNDFYPLSWRAYSKMSVKKSAALTMRCIFKKAESLNKYIGPNWWKFLLLKEKRFHGSALDRPNKWSPSQLKREKVNLNLSESVIQWVEVNIKVGLIKIPSPHYWNWGFSLCIFSLVLSFWNTHKTICVNKNVSLFFHFTFSAEF